MRFNNNKKDDTVVETVLKSNNSYDSYEPIKTNPKKCIIGAIIGTIPGIILWVLLSYLGFSAGIMGFIIVSGSLIVYKKLNKKSAKLASYFSLLFSVFVIFIITTSIEARHLRTSYRSIITDEESYEVLEETLLTLARNSSESDEEVDVWLNTHYGIEGVNDKKGIRSVLKDMLDENYMKEHSFTTVPDSFINSYKCLGSYIESDSNYTKSFFTDLIVGIAFAILAYALITNSTFMYTEEDEI